MISPRIYIRQTTPILLYYINNIRFDFGRINSFGIGDDEIVIQDLSIDSIIVMDNYNDSIRIKCQITSHTNNIYNNYSIIHTIWNNILIR